LTRNVSPETVSLRLLYYQLKAMLCNILYIFEEARQPLGSTCLSFMLCVTPLPPDGARIYLNKLILI
jgi:hypothetical protein